MGKLRVVISIVLITVFLALIGCGGGGGSTPRPNAAGSANPALGSGGTDGGSAVPWWDEDLRGLFPVRMNPQPVKQTGGWPSARHTASVAAQTGLPAPSALARLLPPSKHAAYTTMDLEKAGAEYDHSLPTNRISDVVSPSLIYSPIWGAQAQPVLDDAAYCIYRFNLAGYADSGQPQTLAFAWYPGSAPIAPGGDEDLPLWIGFGNYGSDRWEWYAGPLDDVLTLASFAPYTAASGDVLIAVVVLGSTDCALLSLKVGQPELVALGASPEPKGEDTSPPPADTGSLPSSADLSPDCSPVAHQGDYGSCQSFAVVRGAFDYELGRVYAADGWNFSNDLNLGSPKYMYLTSDTGSGCCVTCGRPTGWVIDYLMLNGVSSEHNAPYMNVCDYDWGQAATDDAAVLNIDRYTYIEPTGQDGVFKLKSALAVQSKPVVMRTGVDWVFMNDLHAGDVWNYAGGWLAGYHAMCIVGYDDAKSAFKVRNSWGTDFCDGGYCWIGYQTFIDGNENLGIMSWTIDVDYDPAVALRFCGGQQELPPPTNVQASDGTDSGVIHVSWTKCAAATGYKVYRDQPGALAATLGDVAAWDDGAVGDMLRHTYWVQATAPGKESALSAPDTGYLGQPPVIVSVRPQTGEPGQGRTFAATVHGAAPFTYAWDFGGGADPNTSNTAFPAVTLGAAGSYNASVTITNSFGSDEYAFVLVVCQAGAAGNWWMFGHDPQHTHRSPFTGPATNAVKWAYPDDLYDSSPVLAADGTVYAGDYGGEILAINFDGTLRWTYAVSSGDVWVTPAIAADGAVYVGDRYSGGFYAFNPDRTLRWSVPPFADWGPWGFFCTGDSSPAIAPDGTVYVAGGFGTASLYAINGDGTPKWAYTIGDESIDAGSSPAIGADGTVYVGSGDNNLYAINPDGTLKWAYPTGGYVDSSPAIGTDGTVYVGSGDNNLYAINPDGTLKWLHTTGGSVDSSPALAADGTVYVGCFDSNLYAINPDGTLKWTYPTGDWVYSSPAVDAAGTIYVGSMDNYVYAINPDGTLKWSYLTGLWVISSPAIGPDGTVYVTSEDGSLYAFGPGAG